MRDYVGNIGTLEVTIPRFFSQFLPQYSKLGSLVKIGEKIGKTFGDFSWQGERRISIEETSLQRAMHKEKAFEV